MKQTIETVEWLKKYFGATVIGSQLFVDNGLLHQDDINDIDLMVSANMLGKSQEYLKEQGFSTADNISFTSNDHDRKIDLYQYSSNHPQTVSNLVTFKFNRGYADDLKQLSMVLFNKGGNSLKSIKDLQDFYNDNSQPNNQD